MGRRSHPRGRRPDLPEELCDGHVQGGGYEEEVGGLGVAHRVLVPLNGAALHPRSVS